MNDLFEYYKFEYFLSFLLGLEKFENHFSKDERYFLFFEDFSTLVWMNVRFLLKSTSCCGTWNNLLRRIFFFSPEFIFFF